MNDKFFTLPKKKQHTIIEAGFRIFSLTSYKKTPVSDIASEAKISKSLLFHYFKNKKELYLFLWNHAAKISIHALSQEKCYEEGNIFDRMERGMEAKFRLIRRYPYMANFVLRAFYEKDDEIRQAIQESYTKLFAKKEERLLKTLNPKDYKPGLDLHMMVQQMYLASEGYLWQMVHTTELDPLQMEQDFRNMLAFWRSVYENKEGEDVYESN